MTLSQIQAAIEIARNTHRFKWLDDVDSMQINALCMSAGVEFDRFFEKAVHEQAMWAPDEFLSVIDYWIDHRFELFAYRHGFVEQDDVTKTDENYWDCICDEQYIHNKETSITCPRCGSICEFQPDSRVNEISNPENHYKP